MQRWERSVATIYTRVYRYTVIYRGIAARKSAREKGDGCCGPGGSLRSSGQTERARPLWYLLTGSIIVPSVDRYYSPRTPSPSQPPRFLSQPSPMVTAARPRCSPFARSLPRLRSACTSPLFKFISTAAKELFR